MSPLCGVLAKRAAASQAVLCARGRLPAARSLAPLAGLFRRHLVLKDNTKQLASQAVSQPGVFDDCHLEALAAEPGVVVGVDGPTHSLDHHQVGPTLPHHHGQNLVQAAARREHQQRRQQAAH